MSAEMDNLVVLLRARALRELREGGWTELERDLIEFERSLEVA
jgi:hypothetical protein